MKTKSFVKGLLFASILPFCSFAAVDNDDSNQEEIQFINSNNTIIDGENETLQVPVTATVNNQVLNVQFTGTVPVATVKVNNALTGTTVSQQTLTAVQGVTCTIPVAGLSWGTITVS